MNVEWGALLNWLDLKGFGHTKLKRWIQNMLRRGWAHIENTHPVADLKSPMFVDKGVFYCTTVELANIVTQQTETEEHENTCSVIAAENIYDAKNMSDHDLLLILVPLADYDALDD